jgi:hypothetical protein
MYQLMDLLHRELSGWLLDHCTIRALTAFYDL